MEWFRPLILGSLAPLIVFQLFWSHTISAIAEKTDQSDLFQVLAWIPLLQIAPTLATGGSGVGSFLIGVIGLVMGNEAMTRVSVFLGNSLGGFFATLGMGFSGLLSLFYFGRIICRTARARDLPDWVALLVFVPVINLFVCPYIAFHDGWVWPNKVGLAIGSILILGSTAPTFRAVQKLDETGVLSPNILLAMADDEKLKLGDKDSGCAAFLPEWRGSRRLPNHRCL